MPSSGKSFSDAIRRLKELVEAQEEEQRYQKFLEENTEFIPREFVQNHGIHFGLLLRKLSMAKDYTTDFFFLSKSSTDWNGVFIEIEKPQSCYFKKNSNEFHQDFLKALQQIGQWRGWLSNPQNHSSFFDSTLAHVRVPIHMQRNPCHPKFVLVFGRRSEFENNPTRIQLINAQERDDFKILTYDSLFEDAHSKSELYLGVRKNEFIDLISNKFIREDMFAWMAPETIRVTEAFKADALKKRKTWFHHGVDENGMFLQMERALPNLRIKS